MLFRSHHRANRRACGGALPASWRCRGRSRWPVCRAPGQHQGSPVVARDAVLRSRAVACPDAVFRLCCLPFRLPTPINHRGFLRRFSVIVRRIPVSRSRFDDEPGHRIGHLHGNNHSFYHNPSLVQLEPTAGPRIRITLVLVKIVDRIEMIQESPH